MKLATDPPVSEKQRKAMFAALHGHSTIGIPKSVAEKFVGSAHDMTETDWNKLRESLSKFLDEEEDEPEHSEDGLDPNNSIPVGLRKQAKDAEPKIAAGVAHFTPDGKVLLLKRSAAEKNYAKHWSFPGGGGETGESPEETAIREVTEETGHKPEHLFRLSETPTPNGLTFHTFICICEEPFDAKLEDGEHSDYGWFELDDLPSPIHPQVKKTLDGLGSRAMDWYALDEASVRNIDADGHLHVKRTPISKANVCPYFGREIPNWQKLGLDPNRIYKLYRHPEELKKGAESFNNKPLLSHHVPMDADHHDKSIVVGSLGTDPEFEHPYLYNSLAVYSREDIDGVETKVKRELSSAYRYDADMTPGTSLEGEPYDGIMRNIRGNHVALVTEGRAGSDVVVGDALSSTMKELLQMPQTKLLSRKAVMIKGTLVPFLAPRLAQDANINLDPILAGITNTNFKAKRPSLVAALAAKLKGKLAQDKNLDDLDAYLMAFDEVSEKEDKEEAKDKKHAKDKKRAKDGEPESAEENAEGEEDKEAEDEEEDEEEHKEAKDSRWKSARDYASKHGMDEEDLDAMDKLMAGPHGAHDEEEDEEERKEAKDKRAKDKKARDKKHGMDKHAMDSAIAAAKREVRENERAIREAERAVRPWTGELTMSFDSADEVYAHALESLGEDIEGIHPSAYPAILRKIPTPEQKATASRRSNHGQAHDSSASASALQKYCPDAMNIQTV